MDAAPREAYDFMHLWQPPNRAFRGNTAAGLSARARYLLDRSRQRFARRADIFRHARVLTMEVGRIESIRFILPRRTDIPTTPEGE